MLQIRSNFEILDYAFSLPSDSLEILKKYKDYYCFVEDCKCGNCDKYLGTINNKKKNLETKKGKSKKKKNKVKNKVFLENENSEEKNQDWYMVEKEEVSDQFQKLFIKFLKSFHCKKILKMKETFNQKIIFDTNIFPILNS